MELILTEYNPRAKCDEPGSFPEGIEYLAQCAEILESMIVTQRPTVFGPASDPTTQIMTPFEIITSGAFQKLPSGYFCLHKAI